MKERTIRSIVLVVIFFVALIGFSVYLNRENADSVADMGTVSLPTISFRAEGNEINLLHGHKNEMDVAAVRGVVTPLGKDGSVKVNVDSHDRKISSLVYSVYQKDGKERVLENTVDTVEETVTLQIGDILKDSGEGILRVQLNLAKGQPIFFYTRIVYAEDVAFAGCMNFVRELHSNMIRNEEIDKIKSVLETNPQARGSLQHVTIQSTPEHATWSKLKPEVIGEVYAQVQETKKEYTSVLLRYQVQCAGDDQKGTIYRVSEFFKVCQVDKTYYLLDYDRTMEERFQATRESLVGKGINLGMVNPDVDYRTNLDGTVVAFVQANELWSYQETDNEFALVFSFSDSEKEDLRNHFQDHKTKILSMDADGNVTFAVYGYMNRGSHEGESGMAIYYFDLHKNVVKETAFIPCNQSYAAIEEVYGKLAYYDSEQNALYVVAGTCLYRIDMETNEQTVILDALEEGKYVSSEDGQQMAYQNPTNSSEVIVYDFATNKQRSVTAESGEVIQPLGFMRKDFVYGVAKAGDELKTAGGVEKLGMYKLEICDQNNEVLKTYQKKNVYVLGATFETNRMNLHCAKKKQGVFREIADDYISNNEEDTNQITLQSYWSEMRGDLYRIAFGEGLSKRGANVLKPKQTVPAHDTTMQFDGVTIPAFYTVYGHGEILGVYEEAGDAILHAMTVSGTVVSPMQNYVWEENRQVAWRRNFDLDVFARGVGKQLKTKSPEEILEEYSGMETVRIQRCPVEELRYLIDKQIPIIAMTGNKKGVVLVGYDAQTVTYISGSSGARSMTFAQFDSMAKSGGNTFFAYLNNK